MRVRHITTLFFLILTNAINGQTLRMPLEYQKPTAKSIFPPVPNYELSKNEKFLVYPISSKFQYFLSNDLTGMIAQYSVKSITGFEVDSITDKSVKIKLPSEGNQIVTAWVSISDFIPWKSTLFDERKVSPIISIYPKTSVRAAETPFQNQMVLEDWQAGFSYGLFFEYYRNETLTLIGPDNNLNSKALWVKAVDQKPIHHRLGLIWKEDAPLINKEDIITFLDTNGKRVSSDQARIPFELGAYPLSFYGGSIEKSKVWLDVKGVLTEARISSNLKDLEFAYLVRNFEVSILSTNLNTLRTASRSELIRLLNGASEKTFLEALEEYIGLRIFKNPHGSLSLRDLANLNDADFQKLKDILASIHSNLQEFNR